VFVEGSHHLHLDAPHSVLPLIDGFLSRPWITPSPAVAPTDTDMVAKFLNPSGTSTGSVVVALPPIVSKL
jgi:hypothetical protein